MSKYLSKISAQELLESWIRGGLIPGSERDKVESFILSQQGEKELPLYLHILAGVGAFIASVCFLVFFGLTGLVDFDSGVALIVLGLTLVAVAVLLARVSGPSDSTVWHSFVTQASFCAMLVGKILFVAGYALMTDNDSEWLVPRAALLITAVTYHLYPLSLDRYLSTLFVFLSLLFNIVNTQYGEMTPDFLLELFLVSLVALTSILFTNVKVKRKFIPLAYAAVTALCIATYFAVDHNSGPSWDQEEGSVLFINTLLTLSLLATIGWAAGGISKLATKPLLPAAFGVVLLGIVSAPGVILAISLMVLGYAKHEKLLLAIGIISMPVFIFFYYYNLEVSLLAKSGVLVGSGALLLIGYAALAAKGLNREEAAPV